MKTHSLPITLMWLCLTALPAWASTPLTGPHDCAPHGMRFIQLKEEISLPRDEVFDFYVAVNPADIIGRNARSKFKGEWDGLKNDFLYENDLSYLFVNLPLDIKFTQVIRADYRIRFEYVNAPSEGFQEIQLFDAGASTKIVHNACYRGKNRLVDLFYPDVHRRVLKPLHRNSKLLLEFHQRFSDQCPQNELICELLELTPLEISKLRKNLPYSKTLRRLKRDLRGPASLTESEWDEFAHLSEGSDLFPFDWWVRLKSARDRDLTDHWTIDLKDNLDKRTGALYQESPSKFMSNVIGLSVTWSNHDPLKADALKSDPDTGPAPMRMVHGETSIRMIGANCAACHTGSIKTETQTYVIPGGQANISLDRFFRDMVISTLALTINFEDRLTEFLVSFDYPRSEAQKIADKFKKDTLKQGRLGTKLLLLIKQLNLIGELPPHFLVKEENTLAERFKALLRLTLKLPKNAPLGNELDKRMEFLAKFATSTPKKTFQDGKWKKFHETRAGYGRIDAFINAFNITLRDKKERADISAPLGYPALWGIDQKKLIHYTGNTNSVLLRNVGQAMGGGAILLDDEFDSTVNIPNLYRLENLMYKIEAPDWVKMFKHENKSYRIDRLKAERGEEIFKQNCAQCHLPKSIDRNYVRPLYDYGVYSQAEIGTDPELARQIVKPIKPLSDPESYPREFYLKETQGIVEAYFKKYNVSPEDQRELTFQKYRGDEWYRDTFQQFEGLTYSPRDLSGIWATAPFLHNNSVPTLWDLLQPHEKRPVVFRQGLQLFDPKKVGAKDSELPLDSCVRPHWKDYKWDEYHCIDTRLRGNSNAGHEFGVELSDEEKWELIEYLKIIKPFKETEAPKRGPASKEKKFLQEFDKVELRNLPLIGNYLEEKDLLRHRLRIMGKWLQRDPVKMFSELREDRPVAFMSSIPIRGFDGANTGVVLLSRYEDVIEVMSQPAAFSVRHFALKFGPWGGHMLSTDETTYNLVEKPWMRGLMPSSDRAKLQVILENLVTESFDLAKKANTSTDGKVRMNLVRDLSRRVPIRLSEEYFGYPGPDMETMYRWSYWMQRDAFHNPTNKRSIRKRALKAADEMLAYSHELIEKTRKDLVQNNNVVIKDTILERLLLSPQVTTQEITDDRVGVNILATLVAGVETTQAAVVHALEYFLSHPKERELATQAARANDLPLLFKYILEALRFNPINPMLLRYTEKDTLIAQGTERETLIPRGTSVFVGTQSAMLDPRVVENPDEFRIDRKGFEYLHFGYGHHKCLGERVAMVELPVILKGLLLKKNLRLYMNKDKKGMPFPEERWIEFDKE